MNPIETIASIFAVLVLVKIVLAVVNPKILRRHYKRMSKHQTFMTIILLTLTVILGIYIVPALGIVQIAAVMFLTALVVGLAMIPYTDIVVDMGKVLLGKQMLKKDWLALVIWVGIVVWTLIAVFI